MICESQGISQNELTGMSGKDNYHLPFAQRYGHVPLPDVMNPDLCIQFRHRVKDTYDTYKGKYVSGYGKERDSWDSVWLSIQKYVLGLPNEDVNLFDPKIIFTLEASILITLIEALLRSSGSPGSASSLARLLQRAGLAPYSLISHDDRYAIIPLSTPDNAAEVAESIEQLHAGGYTNAHNDICQAAKHINDGDYNDAVANSIKSVESIARDITGESTLGKAITKIRKGNSITVNEQLTDGIEKLWGYASHTARHGQKSKTKVEVSRDEAVLVFSLCASMAGYLIRLSSGSDEK